MNQELAGFEWDEGNRRKCSKHGVSRIEIEELFAHRVMILPDPEHSAAEVRFRAIGKTGTGRHVFIVFTIRERDGRRYIRPISARFMHRKEIAAYEEENPEFRE